MKRKICLLLVLSLALGLFAFPGASAGEERVSLPESDRGYIVHTRGSVTYAMDEEAGLTALNRQGTLYRAESRETVEALLEEGCVEYVEPDGEIKLLADAADPLAGQQWYLDYLNAGAAWDRGLEGQGIRVAVLDTGITQEHEDLMDSNIEAGYNYTSADTGNYRDGRGHGTFVAGVLAAGRNNGLGIAGLTDQVAIVPLKVLRDKTGTGNQSWGVKAIYDAVDVYGCDVINMSYGSTAWIRAEAEAVNYALSQGVIVVAAGGNDGAPEIYYPAGHPGVVGVGSVDQNGAVSSFSQHNSSITVAAPGDQIVGLKNWTLDLGSGYARASGTSMATPMVTAMAVMAKCAWPEITPEEFYGLLRDTAQDRGTPGWDEYYGYGVVHIDDFLEALDRERAVKQALADYTDLDGHWARAEIAQAVQAGLLTGVSAGVFAPNRSTTRAMTATVLYRLDGSPAQGTDAPFGDVDQESWYAAPVAWAAESGVTTGTGAATFSPESAVTREQLVTFLQRYAEKSGEQVSASRDVLEGFSDRDAVSEWAQDAMAWAVSRGILSGRSGKLDPKGLATRAELAAVIVRYEKAAEASRTAG